VRLLMLGGTRYVGRAVVAAALAEGIEVTTLNRGVSGPSPAGVRALVADRTDPAALAAALGDGEWDAVIDTWTGPPKTVADAAALLSDRAGHYGYVSSISVYADPLPSGADERAPVVSGNPDSQDPFTDLSAYPAVKRGAELAALRAFGADGALIARAGLILGPYENVGRLPWWLRRIERGGRVLAPGDPGTPLQYVDVRDLAAFLIGAPRHKVTGVFNVTGHPGHATMGDLLEAAVEATGGGRAELVWTPQETVLEAGISPWTELPIWLPRGPEYDAHNQIDASAARAAGLGDRPVTDTVAATWDWLSTEGDPPPRPDIGLDPAREAAVLDAG
jgi:2'-hydroxyisoflavone reductase